MSDPRPRILLVGGDGRPSGVPRHIQHLSDALEHSAVVTVVSDVDRGGYTALGRRGVRHFAIAGLSRGREPLRLIRALRDLMNLIRNEAPDILWLHARLPSVLIRLVLALWLWRPTCQIMVTHHGLPYGPGRHLLFRLFGKPLEKLLLRLGPPQHIVLLEDRMAQQYRREMTSALTQRHHLHVLPNCSDLKPFPSRRDQRFKTLVMTGRADRQKDMGYAVRLFAGLPETYRLILCGPGTEGAAFQRRMRALVSRETGKRITFTGPLADVRPVLQIADAYLLTSRYEGTPIGMIEAVEAGLPIILRNFEGASSFVSAHPCGLLVGEGSRSRDAARIVAMLADAERDPEGIRRRTKCLWNALWSPKIFARSARSVLMAVLDHPRATAQDYVRDGPVPRPDHRRNEAGRVPEPPPCHTTASPSAGSG